MKILILGDSLLTFNLTKKLLLNKKLKIFLFSSKKKLRPNNSIDLKKFSNKNKIPYYEIDDINSKKVHEKIKNIQCDLILSTWHKIIKNKVLKLPKFYTVGSHPTDINVYRGRHPLHWLINMGVKYSYMNFFIMNQYIDDGLVIYKKRFVVGKKINTANKNMIEAATIGINSIFEKKVINYTLKKLRNKKYKKDVNANYFRKRNLHDVTIDIRMTYPIILKIINSFLFPNYPGCRLYYDLNKYLIIKSLKKKNATKKIFNKYEIGHVFYKSEKKFTIKIDDCFVEFESKTKIKNFPNKIYPPSYYFDY
tara:strand:- start:3924 stop:4847 length:924 start_codon:yes stop_codon:yes gene_type:complete